MCMSGMTFMRWLQNWQQLLITIISGNGMPSSAHHRSIPSSTSWASAGEQLWQNLWWSWFSLQTWMNIQNALTQANVSFTSLSMFNIPLLVSLECFPSLSTMVAFEETLNVLSSDRQSMVSEKLEHAGLLTCQCSQVGLWLRTPGLITKHSVNICDQVIHDQLVTVPMWTMDFTVACCVLSFLKDVVRVTLRTFGNFCIVEKVDNVQRL